MTVSELVMFQERGIVECECVDYTRGKWFAHVIWCLAGALARRIA